MEEGRGATGQVEGAVRKDWREIIACLEGMVVWGGQQLSSPPCILTLDP